MVINAREFLITPKIGFDRTLFLIMHAPNRDLWSDDVVSLARRDHIVDAIAVAFVGALDRSLARGPLHGYRLQEDALHTVRGRIRVADQMRRRLGLVPPIEVAFDEFTPDILENRLLLSAIDRLRHLGLRMEPVARRLRSHARHLDEVQLVDFPSAAVPKVAFTRLNDHYRGSVELATLILQRASYELHGGDVKATAFLVDMNRAFEDFVVWSLRAELRLSPAVFPQGARRRLFLDRARRVELRPDISWWVGNDCVFVGDVKYKRTEFDGQPADLYQLLAYAVATGLDSGLLIYAAGEDVDAAHDVHMAGKWLQVRTLDLGGTPAEILGEVAALARRIRAGRARPRIAA